MVTMFELDGLIQIRPSPFSPIYKGFLENLANNNELDNEGNLIYLKYLRWIGYFWITLVLLYLSASFYFGVRTCYILIRKQ
jgi:hypothetical protein